MLQAHKIPKEANEIELDLNCDSQKESAPTAESRRSNRPEEASAPVTVVFPTPYRIQF